MGTLSSFLQGAIIGIAAVVGAFLQSKQGSAARPSPRWALCCLFVSIGHFWLAPFFWSSSCFYDKTAILCFGKRRFIAYCSPMAQTMWDEIWFEEVQVPSAVAAKFPSGEKKKKKKFCQKPRSTFLPVKKNEKKKTRGEKKKKNLVIFHLRRPFLSVYLKKKIKITASLSIGKQHLKPSSMSTMSHLTRISKLTSWGDLLRCVQIMGMWFCNQDKKIKKKRPFSVKSRNLWPHLTTRRPNEGRSANAI